MFGFGEEEEYEQAPKRSIFSSIGDFLLKAATILAIIALAVVTAVTVSDTARDILNDMTKDKKTGQGGLGDSIRSSMGLAKEKATGAVAAVRDAIGNTLQSGKDTLVSAKNQVVETVNTAKNVTLGTAGALAAKKVYDHTINPNTKIKINPETGEEQNLSRKERKAVEKDEKLRAQQEELKTQKVEAQKKAEELRAKAKEAQVKSEAAKAKVRNAPSLKERWKAGREAMAIDKLAIKAETAAQNAESALKKLDKNIIKLEKKITSNSERLPKEVVMTRGEYNSRKAAATANSTIYQGGPTAEHHDKNHGTAERPKSTITVHGQKGEFIADVTDMQHGAAKSPSSSSKFWSDIKEKLGSLKGTAGKLKTFGKGVLAPAAAAGIAIIETAPPAIAAFENGNSEEAAKKLAATAAQAGIYAVTAEAHMAGSLIPDSLKNAVSGTIEDGRKAFLERKLANLPKEQRAIVDAWVDDAKARDLKISPTQIMSYLEEQGLNTSPQTPNTLTGSKEIK
mgnify:FL=1